MAISDIIAGIVFLIISAAIYIMTLSFPNVAIVGAGPDFYPQIISILLAIASITLIIRAVIRMRTNHNSGSIHVGNYKRVLCIFIFTSVYIILLDSLGFIISTFIYLVFMIGIMQPSINDKKTMAISAIVAAAMTLALYIMFDVLFGAALPPINIF